jgi:hypothetical protein
MAMQFIGRNCKVVILILLCASSESGGISLTTIGSNVVISS